jgi:carbamoyl-phosphate synthase large subunit
MNVMITGVGGGGHGEQILKALRLSGQNYTIIGTDMSPISKGLAIVDVPYVVPAAKDPEYLNTILALCKKHDVKVLFHGSEPELKVMSNNRDRIKEAGIFLPINTKEVIDICMDKFKTNEFLLNNGFSFPQTVKIQSMADAEDVDFYPVVLKPSIGGGGSANTMLAQSKEELLAFCNYLLTIYPEFVAQEYIGTPDNEYTACVLTSLDGDYINSIAVKRMIMSSLGNRMKVKNRTAKKELGEVLAISSGVSQGEIDKFPEVTSQCKAIALALGSKGPLNIQCRFVNGKVYVFEINPRYSGTSSLRAMVGFNEPDILIRKHLLGESIEIDFEFKNGFILRGLEEQYISSDNSLQSVPSTN